MDGSGTSLFRPEARGVGTSGRLEGVVSIATPLGWQLVGYLLLGILVTAAIFAFSTSYARTEAAPGVVTLDTGVAVIMPSRSGVVAAVEVREGQAVTAGAVLVRVRAEEDLLTGSTAADRVRRSLSEQDASMAARRGFSVAAAEADQQRLSAQAGGLTAEITSLDGQIADQKRLVEISAASFAEVKRIAEKGFIARRDVEAREANFISHRQQLAQLEQSRSIKMSQLVEVKRTMAQSRANARAEEESARSARAGLDQQFAQAESTRGYSLTAPMAGRATSVTARPGQSVGPDRPLMLIVPEGSRVTAELYVPTAAAGFLSPGQEVRLAVDAFPYQRFGTIDGRVASISSAAIARPAANGTVPAYLVTVELDRPWVSAFGKRHALLPGMTLSARIITERRSLFEWLFEPLFAVAGR